mmetsp:Transcript_53454/g.164358  ORF Transcript_53454/g.164358 Transcript_53454/m.164358 type:complete len:346 (+) Transcript_53454:631-1668(+)
MLVDVGARDNAGVVAQRVTVVERPHEVGDRRPHAALFDEDDRLDRAHKALEKRHVELVVTLEFHRLDLRLQLVVVADQHDLRERVAEASQQLCFENFGRLFHHEDTGLEASEQVLVHRATGGGQTDDVDVTQHVLTSALAGVLQEHRCRTQLRIDREVLGRCGRGRALDPVNEQVVALLRRQTVQRLQVFDVRDRTVARAIRSEPQRRRRYHVVSCRSGVALLELRFRTHSSQHSQLHAVVGICIRRLRGRVSCVIAEFRLEREKIVERRSKARRSGVGHLGVLPDVLRPSEPLEHLFMRQLFLQRARHRRVVARGAELAPLEHTKLRGDSFGFAQQDRDASAAL